jgi:hypothetical protein
VVWRRGLVAVHGWVRLWTGTCVGAWEHGVALGGLGDTVTPGWHRHGMAKGGSEGAASHGIGHRRLGELDGEVIGQRVVGAALATLGIHGVRCQGLGAGEGQVCSRGCEVGSWAPLGMAVLSGWG